MFCTCVYFLFFWISYFVKSFFLHLPHGNDTLHVDIIHVNWFSIVGNQMWRLVWFYYDFIKIYYLRNYHAVCVCKGMLFSKTMDIYVKKNIRGNYKFPSPLYGVQNLNVSIRDSPSMVQEVIIKFSFEGVLCDSVKFMKYGSVQSSRR